MKIFGADKEFIIVNKKENLKVLYSSYSNNVLALNDKAIEIFKNILNIAQKNNGNIDEIYEKYEKNEISSFINQLFDCRILFKSKVDMENSDFNLSFQKKKKINIHKAYLHLTQRCNLKCRYCYNADNIGKTQDLNSEEWKKILFNLREKGFDYIIFTGGEVLLRKDLLELSKYTKQLDFKLNILTNGTFELTRELIETVDF